MKIAMWSGPRNLSTALMYSFASRSDCAVVDEPFYAAYLQATGADHPMRGEILASQSADPEAIIKALIGTNPSQKPNFYQKHMTQHMVPDMRLDWMAQVRNVFLIRHPARVLASFSEKISAPDLEDIGFSQQAALFDRALGLAQPPIVIDSADIRNNPPTMLQMLCAALGLDWQDAMLGWAAGGRKEDGVWAPHWYGAVHRSTGFAGPKGALPTVSGPAAEIVAAAMPHYERLKAVALRAP